MMTQMDPESDGAASQEHRSTAKCSTRKVEMQASASTAVQAVKQRRLHPGPPCISNIPWWTTSSPRGGDGHMGNRIDDHVETHRAQGKQDAVKKAHDESKVMDDSLRPQVPLAPCQAAVHIGAIERRLMATRAVRHLRACLTQADADPEKAMRSAEDIILMWRIDGALLEEEAPPPVEAMMPAISRTTMTVKP